MWRRLIRRNENICDLEHMLIPLSNYFRRRNFSKHSGCFGRILGVKTSRLSYLHYQNPPKTFWTFRKVLAANEAGRRALHVISVSNPSWQHLMLMFFFHSKVKHLSHPSHPHTYLSTMLSAKRQVCGALAWPGQASPAPGVSVGGWRWDGCTSPQIFLAACGWR